jgi:hypothetical protein
MLHCRKILTFRDATVQKADRITNATLQEDTFRDATVQKADRITNANLWGRRQMQQHFSNIFYYYFIPTTCFSAICSQYGEFNPIESLERVCSQVDRQTSPSLRLLCDDRLWWRWGRRRIPYCCKPLRSNAELIERLSPANRDANPEAEGSTALKTFTRHGRMGRLEMHSVWNNKVIKVIKKLNSVAWVRERTIPTERPPLVGEVSANFCW